MNICGSVVGFFLLQYKQRFQKLKLQFSGIAQKFTLGHIEAHYNLKSTVFLGFFLF